MDRPSRMRLCLILATLSSARAFGSRASPTMALGLGRVRDSLKKRGERSRAAAVSWKEYDYVILGGGTAGCVLANRLSSDPSKRVLLVEAGTAPPSHPLVKVPVAILKLFKSKWDWNFATEPSDRVEKRSLYLCRGKGLGGSSCTNVMLYTRGAAQDYDAWADACGDDSWASPAMLEYFKKAETCSSTTVNAAYHGFQGPCGVSDVPYQNEMSAAFLKAAAEEHPAKWGSNPDFNDWSRPQRGFGRYHVSQRDGVRVTAASAYLNKDVLNRPNLDVLTGCAASKVRFDSDLRATGVDLTFASGKTEATIKTTPKSGEVISCSGALGSPQLLKLSGIGPVEELKAHGIDCVASRPGVGAGLQDHPACLVSYSATPQAKGKSHSSKLRIPGTTMTSPKAALDWLLRGRGPLTSPGCDHGGFVTSSHAAPTDPADIQFRFLATKTITPDGMSTIATNYKTEANHPDGFTIQTIAARPKSRAGNVKLASTDPWHKPKISGDTYLADDRDVDVLVDALKKGREIAAMPALASYRGYEEYPGSAVQSDEQLAKYVRETVHSANALVGTCRLGKPDDDTAVVDKNLNVLGVKGFRVADSSVMPTIPGGQTASSTIAIAEKAADMILN